MVIAEQKPLDVIALDTALNRNWLRSRSDACEAQLVELRFFGVGFSVEETAGRDGRLAGDGEEAELERRTGISASRDDGRKH